MIAALGEGSRIGIIGMKALEATLAGRLLVDKFEVRVYEHA
jgi:hypothetical protein